VPRDRRSTGLRLCRPQLAALGIVAESASGVAPGGGEPVAVGLGLLDGQLVGQGAPQALRGGVVIFSTMPLRWPVREGKIATVTP
jgi:hypothetical protein